MTVLMGCGEICNYAIRGRNTQCERTKNKGRKKINEQA